MAVHRRAFTIPTNHIVAGVALQKVMAATMGTTRIFGCIVKRSLYFRLMEALTFRFRFVDGERPCPHPIVLALFNADAEGLIMFAAFRQYNIRSHKTAPFIYCFCR